MLTIETDQGPFLLKVTPTKAHFRSGTAVGRCWAALEDHNGESIEIHTVLIGFLAGLPERGWGLGLTECSIAAGWSFLHPAAAAHGCGSGLWGRSQKVLLAHVDFDGDCSIGVRDKNNHTTRG